MVLIVTIEFSKRSQGYLTAVVEGSFQHLQQPGSHWDLNWINVMDKLSTEGPVMPSNCIDNLTNQYQAGHQNTHPTLNPPTPLHYCPRSDCPGHFLKLYPLDKGCINDRWLGVLMWRLLPALPKWPTVVASEKWGAMWEVGETLWFWFSVVRRCS